MTKNNRFIPLRLWPNFHPWPTEGGLRYLRRTAEEKGAKEIFVKRGGRILVNEKKFFEWVSVSDAA